MGQLRQAQCPVGTKPTLLVRLRTLRWKMLPFLVAGFTLSATAVFGLAKISGIFTRSLVDVPGTLPIVFLLVVCAGSDLAFPRIRPTLFNRQTARDLSGRFSYPTTGFLWGIDAGTVISTFRSSAASWAALLLTFAGWGPWWTGLAYAVGFCVPLGLLIITYPPAAADGEPGFRRASTEAIVAAVRTGAGYVRFAAAVAAIAAVATVASAF
jgi:hypothetical protein